MDQFPYKLEPLKINYDVVAYTVIRMDMSSLLSVEFFL